MSEEQRHQESRPFSPLGFEGLVEGNKAGQTLGGTETWVSTNPLRQAVLGI